MTPKKKQDELRLAKDALADDMIADDMYLNDSESLGVWDDTVPEEDDETIQEQRQMAGNYPILQELVDWFSEQVDIYRSTDALDVNDKMDDYQIARQVMVNKQVVNLLTHKRNELRAKFDEYKASMNRDDNGQ